MSHAILSVKLHELDEKIARMCSRIQLSQCAMRGRLTQEISALEQECAETDLILQERLKFSRAGVVTALSAAYEKIELVRQEAEQRLQSYAAKGEQPYASVEEKILLAEYALDFAMQAADRALLLSLKAIEAQTRQREQDEGSLI